MFNPFNSADKIELCHSEEAGFYLCILGINGNVAFATGSAMTTAALMRANNVRFFDYTSSVAESAETFEEFNNAARMVGFDV